MPEVPIYHLLWSISQEFGGLTAVALRRATAFSELSQRTMDVLTLSPELDPKARQRQLRREGYIGKRVRIRNLWEELRTATAKDVISRAGMGVIVHPDEADTSSHDFDQQLARYVSGLKDRDRVPAEGDGAFELAAENGDVVQIARYRRDGTLLATDRLDVNTAGKRGGRRITLYSRDRKPLAQWSSATEFYHAWVDFVAGREESVVISDSAFVGGMMRAYAHKNVTLLQAIHSHHQDIDARTLDPDAEVERLAPAKMPIFLNADAYDRLVLLTDRQREALLGAQVGSDNLVTIPNPVAGKASDTLSRRQHHRGIAVARLSGLKRIDHGIRAVAAVRAKSAPTLDIYGEGDARAQLATEITAQRAEHRIRLHGHDPRARERFRRASFSLLTSTSEGHSLTIVESMAAGCIPIAYDIEYGPSDIITHGVDGFLVPAGDVEALTETITGFLSMDKADVTRMRRAAIARARDFEATTIIGRWGRVIEAAMGEHRAAAEAPVPSVSATLDSAVPAEGGVDVTVTLTGRDLSAPAWAKLTWMGRNKEAYGRSQASVTEAQGRITVKGRLLKDDIRLAESAYADVFVDSRIDGHPVRARISAKALREPVSLGDRELYATKHGNLSLRATRPAGDPADV